MPGHKRVFQTRLHAIACFFYRDYLLPFRAGCQVLLGKHRLTHVTSYFDHIVVYSDTFSEHLKHLDAILNACLSECVRLKLKKCHFTIEKTWDTGSPLSTWDAGSQILNRATWRRFCCFPGPSAQKSYSVFLAPSISTAGTLPSSVKLLTL